MTVLNTKRTFAKAALVLSAIAVGVIFETGGVESARVSILSPQTTSNPEALPGEAMVPMQPGATVEGQHVVTHSWAIGHAAPPPLSIDSVFARWPRN